MTRRRLLLLGGVALLQVVLVLGLAIRQEVSLAVGREVILRVGPVDPRDMLRGDYVTLRYEIEALPSTVPVASGVAYGQPVWLLLRLDPDGRPLAVERVLAEAPGDDGDPATVALRGEWRSTTEAPRIAFPALRRYYLPEGTGRSVEDAMRRGGVDVRLRVAEDGTAVIAGLIQTPRPEDR